MAIASRGATDGGRLGAAGRFRPAARAIGWRARRRRWRRSDLGALLLFDPNNLRYVTSTAIGTWERDKNIRFALLFREDDPILWDFGSAAEHHQLYCPWLPESSWRAWVPPMRGAMPDATGVPDASRRADRGASCASAASTGEPLGVDVPDMTTVLALQRKGIELDRLAAGDARGAAAEERGRAGAARPGGRDRRRGLRGDLPMLRPGVTENQVVAAAMKLLFELGSRARRGDQRDLRRPLRAAPAHVLRSAAASRRSGVLRHHPRLQRLPHLLLPDLQRRLRDAGADATPTSAAASGSTTRSTSCARASRPTRSPRSGRRRRRSACADERAAFGLQFGHGLGVGLYESPMISPPALASTDPVDARAGHGVRARDLLPGDATAARAARIEEEVVVTADGPQVLTRFPAEELLSPARTYVRGADFAAPPTATAGSAPTAAAGRALIRPSRQVPERRHGATHADQGRDRHHRRPAARRPRDAARC